MAERSPSPKLKRRQRPEYAAQKVGELPDDVTLPRTGPRTDPSFTEAMVVAQGDPDEWYCVATYKSENGARTMLKRIDRKEVRLPAGEWELETRRIRSPEGDGRWSKLYARFIGVSPDE
jgi:hypothetical protein